MKPLRIGGIINRPVADVFAVLSNPENAVKWALSALEEKLTSPPPVRVGSTRRAVVRSFGGNRTTQNEAICTAFEPDRTLAWKSTSGLVPWSVTVDMTPIGGVPALTQRGRSSFTARFDWCDRSWQVCSGAPCRGMSTT